MGVSIRGKVALRLGELQPFAQRILACVGDGDELPAQRRDRQRRVRHAFFQPDGATVDYGAAKAALVNLTKSLAQEFGPSGIRVNAVSPGPVATDLWLGADGIAETAAKAGGVDVATARETIIAGIGGFATGRFTTPEEVASLITLLASSATGSVTGANYVIDGGLIKTT